MFCLSLRRKVEKAGRPTRARKKLIRLPPTRGGDAGEQTSVSEGDGYSVLEEEKEEVDRRTQAGIKHL